MSRLSIPSFLLALTALTACADTTMDLASFDQSCTTGTDCAVVFANVCGCSCDVVAISKSEEERYNTERAAKYEHCENLSCGPCAAPPNAVCLDQVCTLK
ncbi:MAG: hypothetical protein ABI193_09015 [Minicystis sp.]